jgi:hypothetical protein
MGSVNVIWNGCLEDKNSQDQLLQFIARLADCHEKRLEGTPVPRPAFLKALTADREVSADSDLPPQRSYDQSIAGRAIFAGGVGFIESFDATLREQAVIQTDSSDWPCSPNRTSCIFFSENDETLTNLQVAPIRLKGMAFQLYDPRRLYPGEDVMSFVFIDAPHVPGLHGRLVHPHSREQIVERYEGELIQQADWMLASPSVHLRYYLEDWFDRLMSWIRIFFIPDLLYWRHETLHGFEEIRKDIQSLVETEGAAAAKEKYFQQLLDGFDEEANEWDLKIAEMSISELMSQVDLIDEDTNNQHNDVAD